MLSEAVFGGNAMISINGSTPYNAVYGRVPRLLPDINQLEAPEGAARSAPGLISHTHRLREVSVQAMLDGTASARLGRAMNTRTTMAAQHLGLNEGDEVDFYRTPFGQRCDRLAWTSHSGRFKHIDTRKHPSQVARTAT